MFSFQSHHCDVLVLLLFKRVKFRLKSRDVKDSGMNEKIDQALREPAVSVKNHKVILVKRYKIREVNILLLANLVGLSSYLCTCDANKKAAQLQLAEGEPHLNM